MTIVSILGIIGYFATLITCIIMGVNMTEILTLAFVLTLPLLFILVIGYDD